ncbi:MAG: hypothetical protein ACRDB1_04930, partial [Microcoleaceae cyanobacterium]
MACGSSDTKAANQIGNQNTTVAKSANQVKAGKYPIQQASYNDVDGSYSLMLFNTPAGMPPLFTGTDVQMAQLTDEEKQAGTKSYAEINGDQAVLHLTEDFRIEYVHNVTEVQNNPQTGQQETVVIRRESNFWTPFAGAIAGQMVANMLFTPRYYVPPMYSGGVLSGYGGYGSTYGQAVNQYQTTYKAPPAAVKNRQSFRSTGNIKSPSNATTNKNRQTNTNRATGKGVSGTNLRVSNQAKPYQRSKSSFGSGRSSSPNRSYSGGS